jgi:hypothetical protein
VSRFFPNYQSARAFAEARVTRLGLPVGISATKALDGKPEFAVRDLPSTRPSDYGLWSGVEVVEPPERG